MYTEYKGSEIMTIHSMYTGKPKTIGDNREKIHFIVSGLPRFIEVK